MIILLVKFIKLIAFHCIIIKVIRTIIKYNKHSNKKINHNYHNNKYRTKKGLKKKLNHVKYLKNQIYLNKNKKYNKIL